MSLLIVVASQTALISTSGWETEWLATAQEACAEAVPSLHKGSVSEFSLRLDVSLMSTDACQILTFHQLLLQNHSGLLQRKRHVQTPFPHPVDLRPLSSLFVRKAPATLLAQSFACVLAKSASWHVFATRSRLSDSNDIHCWIGTRVTC